MINSGKEWRWMDGKYPQGYFPKITYWSKRWEKAASEMDELEMRMCEKKIMYFSIKQLELDNDRPIWKKD